MKNARRLTRDQRMTIIYGISAFVFILVVLQLWLLTATMDALLGNDNRIMWPAAGASAVCFFLNLGLLRYLFLSERR